MAKKKLVKEISEISEPKIYIGRSLPGLPRYTVFKNGKLPEHVAKIAAENEAVSGLIVPVSGLQEARQNMTVKGHILNHYAKQQSKE